MYRTRVPRARKGERRRFAGADYAALVNAAPHRSKAHPAIDRIAAY